MATMQKSVLLSTARIYTKKTFKFVCCQVATYHSIKTVHYRVCLLSSSNLTDIKACNHVITVTASYLISILLL